MDCNIATVEEFSKKDNDSKVQVLWPAYQKAVLAAWFCLPRVRKGCAGLFCSGTSVEIPHYIVRATSSATLRPALSSHFYIKRPKPPPAHFCGKLCWIKQAWAWLCVLLSRELKSCNNCYFNNKLPFKSCIYSCHQEGFLVFSRVPWNNDCCWECWPSSKLLFLIELMFVLNVGRVNELTIHYIFSCLASNRKANLQAS